MEEIQNKVKNRYVGIDILRVFAIFSVVAVHFWSLNTPFLQTDFDGSLSMFLQGMGHFFFQLAVPLFLMITGYLNGSKKTYSLSYVKGLGRVLKAYLFFSILTFFFRRYYLHESLSVMDGVRYLLDFSLIRYGWYVEMWIGLYLLTPFLNMGYDALQSKCQKRYLLLVLFVLSPLAVFFNRYGFVLLPKFWMNLYPIFFYVIGRYIREYQPCVSKTVLVLCAFVPCLINPIFSEVFVRNRPILQIAGNSQSFFCCVQTIAFFLLIYKIDVKNVILTRGLRKFALLSLDMYLVCYMVDQMVYPWFLNIHFDTQQHFGWYFFVIVPAVFLISAFVSQLKCCLFRLFRLLHTFAVKL